MKFREIESTGMSREVEYCSDNREVLRIPEESLIKLPDDRNDLKNLPDNYETVHKRLVRTEKRLLGDKELEKAYSKVLHDYKEKGFILKVNESDTKEKWYLPNFPVIKPDRETTKVRVVFDASVKENGKSSRGLRRDLVEALLRFRRFSVALAGDVAQMYLCLGIAPKYQPDH